MRYGRRQPDNGVQLSEPMSYAPVWLSLGPNFPTEVSIWVSPFVSRANPPPGPAWTVRAGLASGSGSWTPPGGNDAQDYRGDENLARRKNGRP
jgi:hypothetical protein